MHIGSNVTGNASKLVRKVALAVDATLVSSTPVDTGRARSNWQANIGSPASGTLEPMPAQAAVTLATATIATYKSGETIHLTNNLPYIGALNNGHSAQAPAGFVETAVLDGIAQVKGARLLPDNGVT